MNLAHTHIKLQKLYQKVSHNLTTIDRIMSKVVTMIDMIQNNGFTKRDHFIAYNLYHTSRHYSKQYGIDFGFGDMPKSSKSYGNRQWIEYEPTKNQQGLDANILKGYIRTIDNKVELLKHETA